MKAKIMLLLPVCAAVFILAGGCFAAPGGSPAPSPVSAIPDRPEKLKFPPLAYEPPDPADHRVTLSGGPVAYIIPDHELPLVNLVIYVRTGQYVEPADKTGVSGTAGHLLARGGTRSMTAEQLEERLAFLAAQLNSSVEETQGTVGLNLLAKDLDEGLSILREVLTEPRFQEDKLALVKAQTLQAMKQRNDESGSIEQRERDFLSFGESFWANRHPTAASIEGLTRADLAAFHRKWFVPKNFIVAASGDFDRAAMTAKLEKLFADWPFAGETPPPVPADTEFAKPGVYLVNKEVNQGRVSLMLPGIRRDDPDYFPALVMNHILGGGGFTSRIMSRVRSDEGLAYSAGSSMPGGVYYPQRFTAAFQTKSRTVPYAVAIVCEELRKMADAPVTAEELRVSQRSFIDGFPRIFATKSQTAATFAQEEFTGRYAKEPGFWKTYRARFEAVTPEDVQRAARRFLKPERLVILAVGEKEEILKGHPDHPQRLGDFGEIHVRPLRDPLTMLPLE